MTDRTTVNLSSGLPPFRDILRGYHNSSTATAEDKRRMAVVCALELIRYDTLGEKGTGVNTNIEHLSRYADLIQHALETSND